MGISTGCLYRSRISVERPYRYRIPICRSLHLPGGNPAIVLARDVAEAASVLRRTGYCADHSAMGCLGDLTKSTFFRLHVSERSGTVSRIFLVLFHERTRVAVPEPSVPTRLQYRSAPSVLAVP